MKGRKARAGGSLGREGATHAKLSCESVLGGWEMQEEASRMETR